MIKLHYRNMPADPMSVKFTDTESKNYHLIYASSHSWWWMTIWLCNEISIIISWSFQRKHSKLQLLKVKPVPLMLKVQSVLQVLLCMHMYVVHNNYAKLHFFILHACYLQLFWCSIIHLVLLMFISKNYGHHSTTYTETRNMYANVAVACYNY